MNEGISFDEACQRTPEALTSEQARNCPGDESVSPSYIYTGIAGFVILAAIIILVSRPWRSK